MPMVVVTRWVVVSAGCVQPCDEATREMAHADHAISCGEDAVLHHPTPELLKLHDHDDDQQHTAAMKM